MILFALHVARFAIGLALPFLCVIRICDHESFYISFSYLIVHQHVHVQTDFVYCINCIRSLHM